MLNPKICQKARLSRDSRFDGKFFTAVKTTGIYCRPICPATTPKEQNIIYYLTAIQAANAGYRPCLRCRPDSAPGSAAWKGVNASLDKAIGLIHEGYLQENSLSHLADKLGISDRYLREIFKQHLGVAPKVYALYQQCLFAKQLLHQTELSVVDIALASGFNSLRRFNDCFKSQLKMTPTQIRKLSKVKQGSLELQLCFRPPYDWLHMQAFLSKRVIAGLEWISAQSYGRTFEWLECRGNFTAAYIQQKNRFDVSIEVNDVRYLQAVINNIRRLLDLDVDIQAVELDLKKWTGKPSFIKSGLRLPGIWNMYEAGIRAVLGQQISVAAAGNLVTTLVNQLGEVLDGKKLFPTPRALAKSKLAFLKIPVSRKQTLINLARHYLNNKNPNDPETWLTLKGIGPWTVSYAQMRGLSDPDIYLGADLGIKKSMKNLKQNLNPEAASPWRSYLTFQLWNKL